MTNSEEYLEEICGRFILWFDGFIERVREAEAWGLMEDERAKEAKEQTRREKMSEENTSEQEIEGWIQEIDRQIEGEMDEWTKERLRMEKAAYMRVLRR